MHEHLIAAMAPVLADLRATGGPLPRVADTEWTNDPAAPSAMLWSPSGSGSGISVRLGDSPADRVANAADQVQEWAIEELWADSPTNWPPCRRHPGTHPLAAAVIGGIPRWTCPKDGTGFAEIGSLSGP